MSNLKSIDSNTDLQIVLIRAGATEYERQGRVLGTLDVPLSDIGRKAATQVAGEIRDAYPAIESLYAAPSQAAQETGEMIAGTLGVKLRQLDGVQNLNFGLWQGMRVADVKAKHPKVYRQLQEQPESVRPPQGESLAEVRSRTAKALLKLKKRHKSGVVGLVVPDPLVSIIRHVLRDDRLGNLWEVAGDPQWECIDVPMSRTA